MNRHLKNIFKDSGIALIVSLVLSALIQWARSTGNYFQMAWFGVFGCLLMTINYARNWKLQYINKPIVPSFKTYWKRNWIWQLAHFVIVNLVFILPLWLTHSF